MKKQNWQNWWEWMPSSVLFVTYSISDFAPAFWDAFQQDQPETHHMTIKAESSGSHVGCDVGECFWMISVALPSWQNSHLSPLTEERGGEERGRELAFNLNGFYLWWFPSATHLQRCIWQRQTGFFFPSGASAVSVDTGKKERGGRWWKRSEKKKRENKNCPETDMRSSPLDRLDKFERTHLNKVSEPGLGATQVSLSQKKKKSIQI